MANADMAIWNDLDTTLSSLDVITSRLAVMQNVTEEGEWSVSDTISDTSSHDTWYDALKLTSVGSESPPLTEDSVMHLSPRSGLSEKPSSLSSHSSSLGYHSANQECNVALLSPLSDNSKWTVSSPKSKVRFDELNLAMTKSASGQLNKLPDPSPGPSRTHSRDGSKPTTRLKGIVKSKTTIPITTAADTADQHGRTLSTLLLLLIYVLTCFHSCGSRIVLSDSEQCCGIAGKASFII